MNKILLTAVAGMVAATLFACAPSISIGGGAQDVSRAASEIADFSLPSGYVPEFAGRMGDYVAVSYNPGDGHSHLYLIQSRNANDGQELSKMLENLVPGSGDRHSRLTVIENGAATIRGEAATVVVSDGVNSDGEQYRQVTAGFQGKGGPALLVIEEPLHRWDQASVDAFIASIQ